MKRIDELCSRYTQLETCQQSIVDAYQVLEQCFSNKHKMLICGNGGSAADADHWSGELLKSFCADRSLDEEWQEKLGRDLAGKLQHALPCIPLTQFSALNTAYANDVDPQYIFAQLCWGLGQAGDVLVGISTSGNAQNVCLTVQVAKAKDMPVIALTGQGGGQLAENADVAIRVPEQETYKVQELHLPIYHALCMQLEDKFFN